jgi:hypothetical protein
VVPTSPQSTVSAIGGIIFVVLFFVLFISLVVYSMIHPELQVREPWHHHHDEPLIEIKF